MGLEMGISAVIGLGSTIAGTAIKAGAQGAIANAQQRQVDENAKKMRELAAPTAQELSQLNTNIQNQSRMIEYQQAALKRDEKILSSLDPALVEAGNQAQNLMKGQEAKLLGPIKRQREFQRRQMEQQLSQQYGPGYASSSAGIEALNRFDDSTSMMMANAQEQALGNLGQFLGMGMSQRTNMQNQQQQGFMGIGNLGAQNSQTMNAMQNRQLQAESDIGHQKLSTAGAEHAGAAAWGDMFGQIGGMALGAATSMMGKGMGGSKGGSSDNSSNSSGASLNAYPKDASGKPNFTG